MRQFARSVICGSISLNWAETTLSTAPFIRPVRINPVLIFPDIKCFFREFVACSSEMCVEAQTRCVLIKSALCCLQRICQGETISYTGI